MDDGLLSWWTPLYRSCRHGKELSSMGSRQTVPLWNVHDGSAWLKDDGCTPWSLEQNYHVVPCDFQGVRWWRVENGRWAVILVDSTVPVWQRREGVVAVSYTHLDVYKRQGLGRALRVSVVPVSRSLQTFNHFGVAQGRWVHALESGTELSCCSLWLSGCALVACRKWMMGCYPGVHHFLLEFGKGESVLSCRKQHVNSIN